MTARLRLYVADANTRAVHATHHARHLAEHHLGGDCDLEIIDVIEFPHRADEDRVVATPCLLRVWPSPRRRVIGDLSETARVMEALGFATSHDTGPDDLAPRPVRHRIHDDDGEHDDERL